MKRTLLTVLGSTALLVAVSPTAKASAFLSLTNGVTKSCDNSTAVGVTACLAAGFTTSLGSNFISFSGAVGGYTVVDVTVSSNSPGLGTGAFALDTKTQVQNASAGGTALVVAFAENNFTLPAGTTLTLAVSQSGTFGNAPIGNGEIFTGAADAANSLTPGAGVTESTPACLSPGGAASACATVGTPTNFTRTGAFALSGTQTIGLAQSPGVTASFTGLVNASSVVPEPGSLVLLATGFIGLVGGRRVWRRKA